MALIPCPECGRMVSPDTIECPKCGAPVKELLDVQQNTHQIPCPECGHLVNPDAEECPNCGYPLGTMPAKDMPEPEVLSIQQVEEEKTNDVGRESVVEEAESNTTPSPQKKGKQRWVFILAGVLLAVIIAVAFLVTKNDDTTIKTSRKKQEAASVIIPYEESEYLHGQWKFEKHGKNSYIILTRDNNCKVSVNGKEQKAGTYTIHGHSLVLSFTDGTEWNGEYLMHGLNGEICLSFKGKEYIPYTTIEYYAQQEPVVERNEMTTTENRSTDSRSDIKYTNKTDKPVDKKQTVKEQPTLDEQTDVEDEDRIYNSEVDKYAYFSGDERSVNDYLRDNIVWPQEALEALETMDPAGKGLEGIKIYLVFVIEKDGSISSVRVSYARSRFDGNIVEKCKEAAIRAVESMPKWTPAMLNGKNVRWGERAAVSLRKF